MLGEAADILKRMKGNAESIVEAVFLFEKRGFDYPGDPLMKRNRGHNIPPGLVKRKSKP